MAENIYLAGPFFNDDQIKRISKVEEKLRANPTIKQIFSPREHQHDEFEFGTREWGKVVYAGDIEALEEADAIVAIHDYEGENVDPGTAMEIGFAIKKGIPVIIYQENTDVTANIMLVMPLRAHITNVDDLATYDFNNYPAIPYEGKLI
ncbi:MAG: nucleoside 2-deoxyribosyltransferase [Lactobacillaceae bacterium]|jgi:nucleoside deoxyribosyltransferase|nr:nucleoside 2-deoxyribosyltransferase [Lactobacillaceae bacterium]